MSEAPCRWRTIEHTADLAVEIVAPSLERLFETGAVALAGVLVGLEAGSGGEAGGAARAWRPLQLEAPDREVLLVDWLRELLFVQMTEGLVLTGAEVTELDGGRLTARAAFAEPASERPVERELKGVTYHDLLVERRADGWFARVVFDL